MLCAKWTLDGIWTVAREFRSLYLTFPLPNHQSTTTTSIAHSSFLTDQSRGIQHRESSTIRLDRTTVTLPRQRRLDADSTQPPIDLRAVAVIIYAESPRLKSVAVPSDCV
jgi:hypothetical protein